MPKSPAIATATPTAAADLPMSFEVGLAELNALVASMESGDAPLAQMLANYQRGTQLLKFCESQLKDAEHALQVLAGDELKPLSL